MSGKIPRSAKKNLENSIKFAINFSRMLLKRGKPDFVCENVIQIVHDIYLFKMGEQLEDNAVAAIRKVGINLSDIELNAVNIIEKSMRNEEYYYETSSYIDTDILNSILIKFENFMS
jgi:hypothetical protein